MAHQIDYPTTPDMKMVFGDWCFATLKGIKYEASKGKYTFVFAPDDFMRWKHNIQDSEYDQTWWVIKKEYDEGFCHCVNQDPMSLTWFLTCDYHGNKCDPAIGINKELLVKNKTLKGERDALQKSLTLTLFKQKKMASHPEEVKSELLEEYKKQMRLMRKEEGEEGGKNE